MSYETKGKSNEWYTPPRVFDALGCRFDLDVACPKDRRFVSTPADQFYSSGALEKPWLGFVWMNPPFGNSVTKLTWLTKFFAHGNGIALTPDRTCAEWWHFAYKHADAVLFTKGRVAFVRPDGSIGKGPGTNTCLWAIGPQGVAALENAVGQGLGVMAVCISNGQ